ncbi:MAG: DUF2244 domain-containing protein [Gammaproteobacteria bacterium]
MVAENSTGSPKTDRFILRPNRSMDWRGNLIFLGGLFAITMTVGSGLAIMGFWPVLPLAGIELTLVAIALYHTGLSASRCEVISIGSDTVKVEKGRHEPATTVEFQRFWARVQLSQPRQRLHPSRLLLRSHGRTVEVGSFLTEDEREGLARNLAARLGWAGL